MSWNAELFQSRIEQATVDAQIIDSFNITFEKFTDTYAETIS